MKYFGQIRLFSVTFCIFLILSAGCRRMDNSTVTVDSSAQEIQFNRISTRSMESGSSAPADFTFGLSASLDPKDNPLTDYLWNVKVSQENGNWKSSAPIYWMNGIPICFFAVAPYPDSANQKVLQIYPAGESPALTYYPPEDANGHIDIQTATCTKSSGTVALDFEHILTRVRFTVGKTFHSGAEILEIRINGIYGKGTYNMHTGTWALNSETNSYSIENVGFIMSEYKAAGSLISATLFQIPPQVVSSPDACIEIIAIDDGREIIGTMPLAGSRWDKGAVNSYSICYDGTRFSASMTENLSETGQTIEIDDRNETE